jgi:cobalt-zinc-cadmium efflux system outer membrane protein
MSPTIALPTSFPELLHKGRLKLQSGWIELGRCTIALLTVTVLSLGKIAVAGDPAGLAQSPTANLRLRNSVNTIQPISTKTSHISEPVTPPAPVSNVLNTQQPVAARHWTLQSFESLALQNNPTLRQAAAAVDADRGIYDQVGRYPNPQLGYLRSDSTGMGSQSQGVFVSQEFVTAGKLRKNRDIEAWDIQRLSWDAEAQRMRVLNDVKIRYYELLGAQQAMALSRDLEKIATNGYELTEQLNLAKQASRKDLLQAKVQMNTVRLNLREAEHRYDSAWGALAILIGKPELEHAPVMGELDAAVEELAWKDCWAKLEKNSPQMQAALARVQFTRSELARESVESIPNVNLQVVAERDRATNSSTASTLLSIPVPIFNRNQGNIYRAQAEIRQACAEVERVRLVLQDLLTEAFRRYKTARDQVSSLRDDILPDAEETLEVTTEGYKQGEFGILEVLTARQTYFESSLAYVEALTELHKVSIEIDGLQLTGGLNPAEIGTAIQGAGGGVSRQRAVLNKLQESSSKRLLPAAVQTGR